MQHVVYCTYRRQYERINEMNLEEALEYIIEKRQPPRCIEDYGLSFVFKEAKKVSNRVVFRYFHPTRDLIIKVPSWMKDQMEQYTKLRKAIWDAIVVDYENER